jgi:hypothetical protein
VLLPGGSVLVNIIDLNWDTIGPFPAAVTTASAACMAVFCYGTAPGTFSYTFNSEGPGYFQCGDVIWVGVTDYATSGGVAENVTVQCGSPGVAPWL